MCKCALQWPSNHNYPGTHFSKWVFFLKQRRTTTLGYFQETHTASINLHHINLSFNEQWKNIYDGDDKNISKLTFKEHIGSDGDV
jgi:hypothetical protein